MNKAPHYTASTPDFWFMRKLLSSVLLITLLSGPHAWGQGIWDVGFTAGMANYMGDIGDGTSSRRDFIWDMQEVRTRPAFGMFARRKLDRDGIWHLRMDLS